MSKMKPPSMKQSLNRLPDVELPVDLVGDFVDDTGGINRISHGVLSSRTLWLRCHPVDRWVAPEYLGNPSPSLNPKYLSGADMSNFPKWDAVIKEAYDYRDMRSNPTNDEHRIPKCSH